ncbi:MAG: oxygen-dependent coproporphyrinogen oxidase [Bacteroidota bacterium]
MLNKEQIIEGFKGLQDEICAGLEALDGVGKFQQDLWERPGGGGGRTRIIQGQLIEKGGVNFSAVHGAMPEKISSALGIPPGNFVATGVSIVLHPKNPWMPIIHMNVRYFEMDNGIWWFGGGIDLTPHYVDRDAAQAFHQKLKTVCDQFDPGYYPKFKTWADDYFFIKHRNETRGVCGIFYDRLTGSPEDQERLFEYSLAVGRTFVPAYADQAKRFRDRVYGQRESDWQMYRRGRYVEFNLVWDKGTKFGLDTNGRTESILMSLPPQANWIYQFKAEEGSLEEQTLHALKKEVDWVSGLVTQ